MTTTDIESKRTFSRIYANFCALDRSKWSAEQRHDRLSDMLCSAAVATIISGYTPVQSMEIRDKMLAKADEFLRCRRSGQTWIL